MKIVYASTSSQKDKIKELVHYFYSDIFPLYFSDEKILEFKMQKILHITSRHFEYFDTLGEAFRVITSLQTLASILESRQDQHRYYILFDKNVQILKGYDLLFPFTYSQFLAKKHIKTVEAFSIYRKAANQLLV